MNKTLIIEIDNLSVDYPTENEAVRALDGVDLKIYQHDFICVLGPSGCGKSTLLNVIAGFTLPSAGTFLMQGQPVAGPGSATGRGVSVSIALSVDECP